MELKEFKTTLLLLGFKQINDEYLPSLHIPYMCRYVGNNLLINLWEYSLIKIQLFDNAEGVSMFFEVNALEEAMSYIMSKQ